MGQNRARYRNPELDGLIDRYFVTIPLAERSQVLQAIFHHITDQVVVMPVYYDSNPALVGNRLVNVYPAYYGNSQRWDVKG